MRANAGADARASGWVRMAWAALALVGVVSGTAAGAPKTAPAGGLSALEIVDKNVAARGGLEAWRKVETMVWTGHLESARTPAPSMPFELDQKRPNKTRFELHAMNQRTLRIFDGTHGWKSKPQPSGRIDMVPYTSDEARFARDEPAIDGTLIDLGAKGSQVALAGVEQLDGRKVYHLSVRFASGGREEVWVDAETFLDVKIARLTYGADGKPRMVPTLYRDYKSFDGLQIPTTIQIGDGSMGTPDVMQIERVTLNVRLNDRRFVPPGARPIPAPGNRDASPAPTGAPQESVPR